MNEDSMNIERDLNHCSLRPFGKNNKPKHVSPLLRWRRERRKKSAEYKNVKCKTESDRITNNGHISETKPCIPSPTSLDLGGGSSSKTELASYGKEG